MYAAQAKVRKIDGTRDAARHPAAARPDRDRRRPTALPFRRSSWPRPRCPRPRAARASPRRRSADRAIAARPAIRSSGWPSKGLVALMFVNTPGAMAPWGGSKAVFGTNPVAFACPLPGRAPLVIDLSLSKVARGNVMTAKQRGENNPRRLGARRRGQADHRSGRGAARHDAADGRRQGHRAGADGRTAGGRTDRLELRRRGVVLSRRRGRAVRHRATDHRVRSGGVRRRRAGALRPAGGSRSRRSPARGCRACGD